MFICTYISICVCISTLKPSLHTNWISLFYRTKEATRKDYQEPPSLTGQWAISPEQPWVKAAVVWETAVLALQTSQAPWQAAVCSWEAAGPHLNSSGRKADPQENSWEGTVIGGYISPWINTLASLLSSCFCFQDQNPMKTLETPVLKIRAVQVFKRHRGTGSLLEPKKWGEHCRCVFLSTAMENKWLSVVKYQWIRELKPMPIKSFSCGMTFLWMLNPSA